MFQQLPEVRSPWLMLAMCQHYARPACLLDCWGSGGDRPGLARGQPRHVLAPDDRDATGSGIVGGPGWGWRWRGGSDLLIHINRREWFGLSVSASEIFIFFPLPFVLFLFFLQPCSAREGRTTSKRSQVRIQNANILTWVSLREQCAMYVLWCMHVRQSPLEDGEHH